MSLQATWTSHTYTALGYMQASITRAPSLMFFAFHFLPVFWPSVILAFLPGFLLFSGLSSGKSPIRDFMWSCIKGYVVFYYVNVILCNVCIRCCPKKGEYKKSLFIHHRKHYTAALELFFFLLKRTRLCNCTRNSTLQSSNTKYYTPTPLVHAPHGFVMSKIVHMQLFG